MDNKLIKDLDFKNLEIYEIYYLEQVNEILVEEEDEKPRPGKSSNRPILDQ